MLALLWLGWDGIGREWRGAWLLLLLCGLAYLAGLGVSVLVFVFLWGWDGLGSLIMEWFMDCLFGGCGCGDSDVDVVSFVSFVS